MLISTRSCPSPVTITTSRPSVPMPPSARIFLAVIMSGRYHPGHQRSGRVWTTVGVSVARRPRSSRPQGRLAQLVAIADLDVSMHLARALHQASRIGQVGAVGNAEVDVLAVGRDGKAQTLVARRHAESHQIW